MNLKHPQKKQPKNNLGNTYSKLAYKDVRHIPIKLSGLKGVVYAKDKEMLGLVGASTIHINFAI
ncbi:MULTISPECIES: hypothetical protein [Pseudoalteromonas]|uniref:hypothetical protein n=1 Tax=Pseudoalteromonas TaxID=53246 RepID=UPI001EF610E9|nr:MULTISPECIES: hypothetical protein [Pseudoalteromonas]MCG7564611.1 hypothetical protein [Pseudoalteromonas sp. McH1-42]MEC4088267.1 hypothetical protein [Pseudoalteromonas rubra]